MDRPTSDQSRRYDRPIFAGGAPRSAQRSARSHPAVEGSGIPRPRRGLSLNAKLLIFAVVVLTAIGTAIYVALRPEEDRFVLDTFQYATVGVRDFRNVVRTGGQVVPSEVAVLTAPAAATVVEVLGAVGEDVEEGSLLARLRSENLEQDLASALLAYEIARIELDQARLQQEQQLASARGKVEEAEAKLAEAEAKTPLMEELYALGGISRQELEASRRDVDAARAAVASARESLAVAERQAELAVKKAEQQLATAAAKVADLERRAAALEVRAPQDGRILEVTVRPGSRVQEGATLFRMADVTYQHVETAVTPEQSRSIQAGTPALLRTADAEYPAWVEEVAVIATTGEAGSQVPLRLRMEPEVSARFLPNAPVTVEIELGWRRDRPYLPRGPYFASGNASFVYVLNDDHTAAERRDVRFDAIDGDYVEILSGLEPGEQVVFSSYAAFRSYRTIDLIPEGGRPVE